MSAVNGNHSELRTRDPHFSTKAIHVGNDVSKWHGNAAVPPISLATTFRQAEPKKHAGFEYSRSDNPTRKALEECIASLENAKYGLTYASGLAATECVMNSLKPGDHVLSIDDVYGGSRRLFTTVTCNYGITFSFVDPTDPKKFVSQMQPNTKVVWLESPTNPTLKLADIESICSLVTARDPNVVIVVDNTFQSPYFQQPLELGATLVLHSLTKYMNGHSDVIMGAVATNSQEVYTRLKYLQNAIGAVPSPFDCYLCYRGIKTLAVRMERHMQNALSLAKYLEQHPLIEKLIYPGLPSHPQHELAVRQCSGFSGILSFYVKGDLEDTVNFLKNLKIIMIAESLGSYETLINHAATMTHASVPAEARSALGIGDNFLRMSVGLENDQDLKDDVDQALKAMVKARK